MVNTNASSQSSSSQSSDAISSNTLVFAEYHNLRAYLKKPNGSTEYHQIIDFLRRSHIYHALTVNPTIYIPHINKFWTTAKVVDISGVPSITAKIGDHPVTITEETIRTHLHLDDATGISTIPRDTLFETFQRMGYLGSLTKVTFYKNCLSHQWRFLAHVLQQCMSQKRTGWSEFGSILATAMVALSTNQRFNFSRMIFEGMVSNLKAGDKTFLMYPRFIEEILRWEVPDLPDHSQVLLLHSHTKKIFNNMKRGGPSFSGMVTSLFSTMVSDPQPQGEEAAEPTVLPTPPSTHNNNSPALIENQPDQSHASVSLSRFPPNMATYGRRRSRSAPSIFSTLQTPPESPHQSHGFDENINRETLELSPRLMKVVYRSESDHVGRANTTVSSQSEEHDSIKGNKTQLTATPDRDSFFEEVSEGGIPRRQETEGVTGKRTRSEPVTTSKDVSSYGTQSLGTEDRKLLLELTRTCKMILQCLDNQSRQMHKMERDIEDIKQQVATKSQPPVATAVETSTSTSHTTDAPKKGEKMAVDEEAKDQGGAMQDENEGENMEIDTRVDIEVNAATALTVLTEVNAAAALTELTEVSAATLKTPPPIEPTHEASLALSIIEPQPEPTNIPSPTQTEPPLKVSIPITESQTLPISSPKPARKKEVPVIIQEGKKVVKFAENPSDRKGKGLLVATAKKPKKVLDISTQLAMDQEYALECQRRLIAEEVEQRKIEREAQHKKALEVFERADLREAAREGNEKMPAKKMKERVKYFTYIKNHKGSEYLSVLTALNNEELLEQCKIIRSELNEEKEKAMKEVEAKRRENQKTFNRLVQADDRKKMIEFLKTRDYSGKQLGPMSMTNLSSLYFEEKKRFKKMEEMRKEKHTKTVSKAKQAGIISQMFDTTRSPENITEIMQIKKEFGEDTQRLIPSHHKRKRLTKAQIKAIKKSKQDESDSEDEVAAWHYEPNMNGFLINLKEKGMYKFNNVKEMVSRISENMQRQMYNLGWAYELKHQQEKEFMTYAKKKFEDEEPLLIQPITTVSLKEESSSE